MDILVQTLRKEGFFALYKGNRSLHLFSSIFINLYTIGMASPLLGIAGVNSLLFASYGASRRLISPFPLSLKETALAGSMAGVANAILASPGRSLSCNVIFISQLNLCCANQWKCSKSVCKDSTEPKQISASEQS